MAPGDYAAASGTLTFSPGQTAKQIVVAVNGDTTVETTETFTVNLVEPVERDDRRDRHRDRDDHQRRRPADGDDRERDGERGELGDDELRVRGDVVGGEREHGDGRLRDRRTARRSRRATTPPTSGTLTFSPGQTAKQIVVAVNGDTTVETTETFTVNLSNPTNATIAGTGIGTGTITNDDALPTLTIGERDGERGELRHDELRVRGHAVGGECEHGDGRLLDLRTARRSRPATTPPARGR